MQLLFTLFLFCLPSVTARSCEASGYSAKEGTSFRSCKEWLDAQGSKGANFFPLVFDYLGWGPGDVLVPGKFALVDYAGLANKYLKTKGIDLKTDPQCTVIQEVSKVNESISSGSTTTTITVILRTENALGFSQSFKEVQANFALKAQSGEPEYPFLATKTIFGNKAQDVENGADAALGPVDWTIQFTIAHPGAPLPDLFDVFGTCAHSPGAMSYSSVTYGPKSSLYVDQEAFQDFCTDSPAQDVGWTYTREEVEIVPNDKNLELSKSDSGDYTHPKSYLGPRPY